MQMLQMTLSVSALNKKKIKPCPTGARIFALSSILALKIKVQGKKRPLLFDLQNHPQAGAKGGGDLPSPL